MQESVDATAEQSTSTTSSEPSSDTGNVDSVASTIEASDTQAVTTSSASGPSGETDSATADTQQQDGARSLTASAETTNPQSAATPEIDYKARFVGAQKSWQQERDRAASFQQQLAQYQKRLESYEQQYQGIQPQDIEAFRASQSVKMWDSQHQQHQQFLELRRAHDHYTNLLNRAPDDQTKQWLAQQMRDEVGPEGIKTLRDWQADVRRQEWERQNNPEAFYRKLIQKEAQPVIRESLQNVSQTYQQTEQARGEVQKWIKDNQTIANPESIKQILTHMESGMPFQLASSIVERDYWKSQSTDAMKAKQSAEEKERLLQGNAAAPIARNPKASKRVDPRAIAQERGVKNSRQFADLLFELDAEGAL
jgi:hypothetical protein